MMISRNHRMSQVRAVALAAGIGVLGSLAFTSTSLGAAPTAGAACQAADGKVSGRGATFQTDATRALINGYRLDVCGPVAADAVAGNNMLAYNYPAAEAVAGATGSGAGRSATSCRTDAFGGSDAPYTKSQLTSLNGAKGALGGCGITFSPPFAPAGPYPAAGDANGTGTGGTVRTMSIPVGGGAVAIAVRLDVTASCATVPTSVKFAPLVLSRLLGGVYLNWNDPELAADNPGLAGCDKPIKRLVRADSSGTTQTLKNYLKNVDAARTGATCQGTVSWTTLATQNIVWPNAADGTCSSLQSASGSPNLVALLGGNDAGGQPNDGGVAYADLSDWNGTPFLLAELAAATTGAFQAPGATVGSNCAFAGALPGNSAADAVGLSPSLDVGWATDATSLRSDFTNKGSLYPVCALTWDLIYTSLNGNSATTAIAGLSANQRRTLYSYFTYVLSPAGQARLAPAGYTPLPAGFLTKLRQGFQAGF